MTDRHEALKVVLNEWADMAHINMDDSGVNDEAQTKALEAIEALYADAERVARLDELTSLRMAGEVPDDIKDVIYRQYLKHRIVELSLPQQAGGEQHGDSE